MQSRKRVCKEGECLCNQENVCAGVCKGGKRVCNQKIVCARKEQMRDFMRHNTTKNKKRENSVKMRDSDEDNCTHIQWQAKFCWYWLGNAVQLE